MSTQRPDTRPGRPSALFSLITVIFIACLVVSNIIAVKLVGIGPLVLPAAIIVFPITYIFGDVLTEVYGYRRARLVIWMGFLANLIVVVFIALAQIIPPASFWDGQAAYVRVLGYTPRILGASFIAYLVGEFLNSFVLSRLKILTKGRFLWVRTIGSTLVGQLADSGIFITVAFVGAVTSSSLVEMIVTQWLFKVAYEAALTPATYAIVGFIKRRENVDAFDHGTDYNPFKVRDAG